MLTHIPGNVLQGNWRAVVYVDDKGSPEQKEALLNVWSGKEGGPVADLVQLVREAVAVKSASMSPGPGPVDLQRRDRGPDGAISGRERRHLSTPLGVALIAWDGLMAVERLAA